MSEMRLVVSVEAAICTVRQSTLRRSAWLCWAPGPPSADSEVLGIDTECVFIGEWSSGCPAVHGSVFGIVAECVRELEACGTKIQIYYIISKYVSASPLTTSSIQDVDSQV